MKQAQKHFWRQLQNLKPLYSYSAKNKAANDAVGWMVRAVKSCETHLFYNMLALSWPL